MKKTPTSTLFRSPEELDDIQQRVPGFDVFKFFAIRGDVPQEKAGIVPKDKESGSSASSVISHGK